MLLALNRRSSGGTHPTIVMGASRRIERHLGKLHWKFSQHRTRYLKGTGSTHLLACAQHALADFLF